MMKVEKNYEELINQLAVLKSKTTTIERFLEDTKDQFEPTKVENNLNELGKLLIDVANDFEIMCMMVNAGDHYKYFN